MAKGVGYGEETERGHRKSWMAKGLGWLHGPFVTDQSCRLHSNSSDL